MPLELERLPPELLLIIAADVREYHVPSFVALASASKTLRTACAPTLFSAIVVEPPFDKIEPTASRCMVALSTNNLLRHVRRLFLRPTPLRMDWEQPLRPLTNFSCLPGTVEVDPEAIAQAKSSYMCRYDAYDGNSIDCKEDNIRVPRLRDAEWLPAVHLIEALPNLRDVTFDARCDVVPSCLLESLREVLPRCRLRVNKLQTMSESDADGPISKPDDIAHLPVSSLHHITIHQVAHNPFIHSEGAHGLEAPFAPFKPSQTNSFSSTRLRGEATIEKRATSHWQRVRDPSTSSTNPSLVSLSLISHLGHLSSLSKVLDTSTLHSLYLGERQCYSLVDFQWMAENDNLPNLKHLLLAEFPRRMFNGVSPQAELAQITDNFEKFLGRLPPLEHLDMRGSIPASLVKGLLSHHGPALRKLAIRTTSTEHTFTEEVFQLISEHCGVLQELEMPLQRTTSGSNEAIALDALGSIRSLQTLKLRLAWQYVVSEQEGFFNPWRSDPPESSSAHDPLPQRANQLLWNAWDHERSFLSTGNPDHQPIYNGDIRDAFIRAAIDEKFARAVWDRLCRQGCRLRLLDLHSSSIMRSVPQWDKWKSLGNVTRRMGTHIILQRSMADDDTIFAVDMFRLRAGAFEASSKYEMPYELMEHFRRLWPSKSADGSWQDDWSSLPFPLTSIPTS